MEEGLTVRPTAQSARGGGTAMKRSVTMIAAGLLLLAAGNPVLATVHEIGAIRQALREAQAELARLDAVMIELDENIARTHEVLKQALQRFDLTGERYYWSKARDAQRRLDSLHARQGRLEEARSIIQDEMRRLQAMIDAVERPSA